MQYKKFANLLQNSCFKGVSFRAITSKNIEASKEAAKFESILVKILFCLLAAYFVWEIDTDDHIQFYPGEWGEAHWIGPSEDSPVAVFRQEFNLPRSPEIAWIQLAAPDRYTLYINNIKVSDNVFCSETPTGVHDITNYLREGKNVVGVVVRRLSFPGSAKILVHGGYKLTPASPLQYLDSGNTWRVLTHEDRVGYIPWTSPKFEAYRWPRARDLGIAEEFATYPLFRPPSAVTTVHFGDFIALSNPTKTVRFQKEFRLPGLPSHAWVRLSASKAYTLFINGLPLTYDEQTADLKIYHLPKRIFKQGVNRLEIVMQSARDVAPQLYIDGLIGFKVHGNVFLKTDLTWKASDFSGRDLPIIPLGKRELETKSVKEVSLPFFYYGESALIAGGVFLVLGLVIFIGLKKISLWVYYPPLILLAFLIIFQFDSRIPTASIFTWTNFLLVMGVFLLSFFLERIKGSLKARRISSTRFAPTFSLIAFAVILAGGMYVRLKGLDAISLNGDEIGTVRFAKGILERGYPYIQLGDLWKPATTYELLPYPIALSLLIFQQSNEFVVRLPAVCFSLFTMFTLYWVVSKLISSRAALLVTLIYAFMPLEINMAQNARYIQMCQFWALITAYFYYKGIEDPDIRGRYLYLASLFFSLGYLTWEGFGYILPALLFATFFLKGRDLSWMKSWPLWVAAIAASTVVLLQLLHRTYWGTPYLIVGSGISDSSFKFMPLHQVYNPWYYLKVLFLNQYMCVPFFFVLFFLPVVMRSKVLRYWFLVLFWIVFFLTNTFPLYATRYIYYVQPLFLIVLVGVLDKISLKPLVFASLGCLLFLVTNDYILKLYRLSPNPYPITSQAFQVKSMSELRQHIYPIDFRGCNEYVKKHLRDEDIVVSVYTHPTLFFAGKVDYFLQSITDTQLVYLEDNYPRLVNKTIDVPAIRNLAELRSVLSQNRRAWFVLSSYGLFTFINSQNIVDFITEITHPVFESYGCRVYLWENQNP